MCVPPLRRNENWKKEEEENDGHRRHVTSSRRNTFAAASGIIDGGGRCECVKCSTVIFADRCTRGFRAYINTRLHPPITSVHVGLDGSRDFCCRRLRVPTASREVATACQKKHHGEREKGQMMHTGSEKNKTFGWNRCRGTSPIRRHAITSNG